MRVGYFNYKDGAFTVSYDASEKQAVVIMDEYEAEGFAPWFQPAVKDTLDIILDEEENDEYTFKHTNQSYLEVKN